MKYLLVFFIILSIFFREKANAADPESCKQIKELLSQLCVSGSRLDIKGSAAGSLEILRIMPGANASFHYKKDKQTGSFIPDPDYASKENISIRECMKQYAQKAFDACLFQGTQKLSSVSSNNNQVKTVEDNELFSLSLSKIDKGYNSLYVEFIMRTKDRKSRIQLHGSSTHLLPQSRLETSEGVFYPETVGFVNGYHGGAAMDMLPPETVISIYMKFSNLPEGISNSIVVYYIGETLYGTTKKVSVSIS